MPKSKRSKLVTLAKTEKRTREDKEEFVEEIRQCVDKYAYTWAFRVNNMRNTYLKDLRQQWKGSRIFFGRTKVMQIAFGRNPEGEHREHLHEMTKHMTGDMGLLMTDESPETVKSYFNDYVKSDYARAGVIAPLTFTIPAGVVYSRGGQIPQEDDVPLVHSLESTIRNLGVPSRLKHGKVELSNEHTVCVEGKPLNSQQTQLLKMFGIACSNFTIDLKCFYDRDKAEVVEV